MTEADIGALQQRIARLESMLASIQMQTMISNPSTTVNNPTENGPLVFSSGGFTIIVNGQVPGFGSVALSVTQDSSGVQLLLGNDSISLRNSNGFTVAQFNSTGGLGNLILSDTVGVNHITLTGTGQAKSDKLQLAATLLLDGTNDAALYAATAGAGAGAAPPATVAGYIIGLKDGVTVIKIPYYLT